MYYLILLKNHVGIMYDAHRLDHVYFQKNELYLTQALVNKIHVICNYFRVDIHSREQIMWHCGLGLNAAESRYLVMRYLPATAKIYQKIILVFVKPQEKPKILRNLLMTLIF